MSDDILGTPHDFWHKTSVAIGYFGKAVGSYVKKKALRASRRIIWLVVCCLALVIIPMSAIVGITGAGEDHSLWVDKDRYQRIADSVNPSNVPEEHKLTWGILKAAFLVLYPTGEPSDAEIQALARSLAPKAYEKQYAVEVTAKDENGNTYTEIRKFTLCYRVQTYNRIYEYDYEFKTETTEQGPEVTPVRKLVSVTLDRAPLTCALQQLAGYEIDPFTVQLIEQSAISFDTGKADYSWLLGPSAEPEGTYLSWPIAGKLTSSFGVRVHPITGELKQHTGWDIAAETGTPIPAVQAGVVTLAGSYGDYGLCVIVRHAGGYETLYGHCSRVLVTPGQSVCQGQILAEVGSTGLSTGPHLHFEVRYNGQPVDPGVLKP